MAELFRIYNESNLPLSRFLTASEVVFLFSENGVLPHQVFPSDWSIEWFTGTVSRGMVSFDQVKRFADGGPLI